MWVCLSLIITLCLLHGGGAESDGGGPRCQLPPAWKIGEASRMDGLRQKLESQGLKDVVYMVVNQQGAQARRLHTMLGQRLSENITLYKQDEQQPDVWQALGGEKDDFLIYDRCGRLTHHISLPYSIIGQGHVDSAIKDTYCTRMCGDCIYESTETAEECSGKANTQPDTAPAVEGDTGHAPHHGHHHGHHHHGDNQGVHHHGHGHSHGQHHGNHDEADQQGVIQQGHEHHGGVSQRQDRLDLDQQAVNGHQIAQEALGALVRP
ncbi:hypothetical protein PBY51_003940 [Eleginops maclovinus]|uniref:Selenoprotein P N-terminal domain-containing protein n=1 Tax=Eleginops maclovinus TaxID=56733 RepID=A0AAN7XW17_ELEMC|nr:hypothetical protein PBY51_003940 [Eleginops maclovinus]